MIRKTFPKELMLDLLNNEAEGLELISDEMVDQRRWVTEYEIIFREGDKFYRAHYDKGSTENQDTSPWEFEDNVSAVEVVPKEITVIQYVNAE